MRNKKSIHDEEMAFRVTINQQGYIDKLNELVDEDGEYICQESGHIEADKILIRLIEIFGLDGISEAYQKPQKRYS